MALVAGPVFAQLRDGGVDGRAVQRRSTSDEGATPEHETSTPTVVRPGIVPEGEAVRGMPVPAMETASLTGRACLRSLMRAGVPFVRIRWALSGIVTPVIVTGPIEGVTFRSARHPRVRETMDCLLALALVPYARFLRSLGVREVRHMSIHRPKTPDETRVAPVQMRHAGGLAIDASIYVRDDGTEFVVWRDFHGLLGAPVCGPSAEAPTNAAAIFLRLIFCGAARAGLFNVNLSPNYNEEHHNHFHLEVTRGVSWRFVR
jgi:hypothetical protein